MALTKIQIEDTELKTESEKIVSGTAAKPRLSVFRSNKEISCSID